MNGKKIVILILLSLNFCLQTKKMSFDFKNNPLFGFGFLVWSDANSKYTVGGSLTGFSSGSLILSLNGTDETFSPASSYKFAQTLASGKTYAVTVKTNPTGYVCTVSNSTGTVGSSNITNVNLSCALITVTAAYTSNGANWNDYVNRDFTKDIFSQTDTVCNTANTGGYRTCVHGGEVRKFDLASRSACTTLTASDDLSALNWVCRTNTSGGVTFYSSGLKKGKYLSDLIDWTTNSWKSLTVTVKDGTVTHAVSNALKLWSNVIDASGTVNPSMPGTIYIYSSNVTGGQIRVNVSDKTAVVFKPGTVYTIGTASASGQAAFLVTMNFSWIEGLFNTGFYDYGMNNTGKFNVLRNFKVQNCNNGTACVGIFLNGAKNNYHEDIIIANMNIITTSGGLVLNSNANWNYFKDIRIFNGADSGIKLDNTSSRNTFSDLIVSSSGNAGASVSSGDQIFLNTLIANSGTSTVHGFFFSGANKSIITNTVSLNNSGSGVYGNPINYMTFENNAWIGNADRGMDFTNASGPLIFRGQLRIFMNTSGMCNGTYTGGGMTYSVGICTPASPSDSISVNSSSFSFMSVFSGIPVASVFSDSANSSYSAGSAAFSNASDFLNFQNPYRIIGKDPSVFPGGGAGSSGRCSSGTCKIWDFSLKSSDTILKNSNLTSGSGCPSSSSTYSHSFSTDTVTVLRNSVEIIGDGIGNDNGLCEANEDCIFTPNIGAYQGHGNLVSSSTLTGGCADVTSLGIKLYQYETNGY